jgi:hypothetical protein
MTNQEERVLGRKGARVLNTREAITVNGGITTKTLCTPPGPGSPRGDGDADIGEC